jgi:hypothetical protein
MTEYSELERMARSLMGLLRYIGKPMHANCSEVLHK